MTGESKKISKREAIAGNQGTAGVNSQAQGAQALETGPDGKPCARLALDDSNGVVQDPAQGPVALPGDPGKGSLPNGTEPPPPGGYPPCGPVQGGAPGPVVGQGPGQGPGVSVGVDINNQGKGPGVPGGPGCIGSVCVQVGVGIPGKNGGCLKGGCPVPPGPGPGPGPGQGPCGQGAPCPNTPCDQGGHHQGWGGWGGGSKGGIGSIWKKGGC